MSFEDRYVLYNVLYDTGAVSYVLRRHFSRLASATVIVRVEIFPNSFPIVLERAERQTQAPLL